MEEEYFGGSIFGKIEVDDRITPDLTHCLYCYVMSNYKNNFPSNGVRIKDNINYKILLDPIKTGIKRCPACMRVYILTNPIE